MQTTLLVSITALLALSQVSATPTRPEMPVEELCELYKEKCQTKLQGKNCTERAAECISYVEQGLQVTWSFCNFLNNDDVPRCTERLKVDMQVIKQAVLNDTFKFVPN